MTFQQVLDMIRDAAEKVNPTGTFVHGRNSDAANSDKPYPKIILYPFRRKRDDGALHIKNASTLMAFVEADSGDQDSDEREGIISRMDTLCEEFLSELESTNDNSVQLTNVEDEPQYQILEGTSGYSLSFNLITSDEC